MNFGPAAGPLLRPRASESGSIFHETGIWPAPGPGSRLRDPLTSASEVEMGNIVEGVMGPRDGRATSPIGATRLRGGMGTPGDPFAEYVSPVNTTPGSAFVQRHYRGSSTSSNSGVDVPLLAAAATSATPQGSVRSRLALVTPAVAGRSANPFADSKSVEAASLFRSGRSNPASASASADGHTTMSEGHGHGLTLGTLPSPGPRVGNLVDLTPGQEAELTMPAELPPQYHTIRRDSDERHSAAGAAR
ncbi:hypothetical protein BKA62DRAFT_619073 [Auriculariales sp. MPI-PUGE-AT-0066]|nr:hypothetical protein BKA62DRAFT_619073 [Auriculariales sp. MPI-PUGE-AT-0066]